MNQIHWPEPKITSSVKAGTASMQARFAQASVERDALEKSNNLMKSYRPVMAQMLQNALQNQAPITVTATLKYPSSELQGASDDDDGFYMVRKSQTSVGKYVDVVKEVPIGTQLILKSLDAALQEFIFVDQRNREHVIPYVAQEQLMTHTNIASEAQNFINIHSK